jgi:hypothetical protein
MYESRYVLARPTAKGWSKYSGVQLQGRDDFRPCLIIGEGTSRRIEVIGNAYAFDPAEFEIGPDIDCAPQPAPPGP